MLVNIDGTVTYNMVAAMTPHEETLLDAAVREFVLLYDEGRDLPEDLVRACTCTIADLERGEETPDLIQAISSPTDDGRICVMVCPGWRLMGQIVRLRRHRTKH